MDERLEELLERLTASGPKCCAVSASETHEIVDLTLELQKENKELRCYIERLREELNNLVAVYMPREGSGAGSRGVPDCLVSACVAITETPTQSLAHIQAQVEEDTIGISIGGVTADRVLSNECKTRLVDMLQNQPRKYAKDGE